MRVTALRASAMVVAVMVAVVGTAMVPAVAKTSKKADVKIAQAATLKLSDLRGTGWTERAAEPADLSRLPADAPAACAPFQGLNQSNADAARGFVNDGGAQVLNAVALYQSVKQAKRYFVALKNETAAECLDFALGGAPPFNVANVSIGSADDGVGFETQYESSTGAVIYLQVFIYRVGRATITFLTQNYDAVFPDTDELVLSTVARLKKSLK